MRFHAAQSTLHPVYGGTGYSWYNGAGGESETFEYTDTPSEVWQRSPLYALLNEDLDEIRVKMVEHNEPSRFPLLNDLREVGATDYYATGLSYEGAKQLRSQGYRAEAELASAAAALASAEADLVNAQRNLERTEISLPYEGMVLSKDSDLGQFVNPGTQLGITFSTEKAEVRLPLTDQELAFVDIPDTAEIRRFGTADGPAVTLQAIQRGKLTNWEAKIVRSEGVVDERSRVTYLVAEIEDPYRLHSEGPALPMGTFVSAKIAGSNPVDLIRVPRSAMRGSDQLLFVTEEDTIEIRTVDVLRADARFAYLSGGATAGERITTTAIQAPTNGMAVRTEATVATEPADEDIVATTEE